MKRTVQFFLMLGFFLMVAVVVAGCAAKSFIQVGYRLPAASDEFKGKRVFLDCKDMRSDQAIFGPNAQAEFKHFSGLFSLSVNQGDKSIVVGAFDLPTLFKKAFAKRFERLGIDIAAEQEATTPVIEIIIKKFQLDLVDRNWVSALTYEARLLKDKQVVAQETVSGDAERFKVFGQGDAEKVLGDIFTEVVNRLDVGKMIGQASL